MDAFLVSRGMPADRVLLDPFSRHSTTNLRNAGRMMLSHGWKRALIVTGWDHVIFDQASYFANSDSALFSTLSIAYEQRCIRELGYSVGQLEGVDAHHIAYCASARSREDRRSGSA